MKKLILLCCLLFGANAISQAQTTKCGVYQLINTKESKNVLKDHNIVLEKGANGKISGRAAWKSGWIGDNLQRSYAAALGKGVIRF